MKRPFILVGLTCGLLLGLCGPIPAQGVISARDELLSLVPGDAGFCLSLQNLRDESEKWSSSVWFKEMRASAVGQAIKNSPEMQRLVRFDGDLQKRFGVDWTKLRDDIFGDAIVLAYWPALPDRPEQEQGLLLIRARRADLLQQLVDKLQQEQLKSKELKRLDERQHKGVKYYLREDKKSEHFLLVEGNLLVFAGKESLVRSIIDRRQGNAKEKGVIVQQINRAGAERALATLWINPRAFDAELGQRAKLPGPDARLLQTFLTYWRPLEAVVLSVSDVDDFEIRLAIQARTKDLPASVHRSFTGTSKPSELWQHFPDKTIMSMAGHIDAEKLATFIGDFLPPASRKAALDSLQKYIGTAIKMDLARDLLPNIGPDWGMFLALGDDASRYPDVLTALAVRPGNGPARADQALLDGVNILAMIAVLANSDDLAIKRVWQDKVQVSFLTGGKAFPQGVRPAWALKDGYLIFASNPEAVLRFRKQNGSSSNNSPKLGWQNEVPVLMLSTSELARLLRANKDQVIDQMMEKNKGLNRAAASQNLDDALRIMDLIYHVTFLQGSGNGQLTWTVRIRGRSAP